MKLTVEQISEFHNLVFGPKMNTNFNGNEVIAATYDEEDGFNVALIVTKNSNGVIEVYRFNFIMNHKQLELLSKPSIAESEVFDKETEEAQAFWECSGYDKCFMVLDEDELSENEKNILHIE